MINHNVNLKNKDMKKPFLHFLATFIFCFSFCLGAENNYTEKNNLPKPTPHFLFSHFIPPGFDLFSPNYQFISDFITATGRDRVRRVGQSKDDDNDQDGNEIRPSREDLIAWARSGPSILLLGGFGILNPMNGIATYRWTSDWFTDNRLGINEIQIGGFPDIGGGTHRNYILVEENPLDGNPSFLNLFFYEEFGNEGPAIFYGPVNTDRNSPQYGATTPIGALMGGHVSPGASFFENIRRINIDANLRPNQALVMDRNAITLGDGFEGNIRGSLNRQIYYWGYEYGHMVNNLIRNIELVLMNGIAHACTTLIRSSGCGESDTVVRIANLGGYGRPFDMGQYPNGVPPNQTNVLGFRYMVSFMIIEGRPLLSLHWENHTYQMQGAFVLHRFFDAHNGRFPRKLSEGINFLSGKPTAIENDHIKSTENLHLGQMLISEDESKVLISAKDGLHVFDMPKGSSEVNLLQKTTH
jgi:hypothetical protein